MRVLTLMVWAMVESMGKAFIVSPTLQGAPRSLLHTVCSVHCSRYYTCMYRGSRCVCCLRPCCLRGVGLPPVRQPLQGARACCLHFDSFSCFFLDAWFFLRTVYLSSRVCCCTCTCGSVSVVLRAFDDFNRYFPLLLISTIIRDHTIILSVLRIKYHINTGTQYY